jgi:hypothetical protein
VNAESLMLCGPRPVCVSAVGHSGREIVVPGCKEEGRAGEPGALRGVAGPDGLLPRALALPMTVMFFHRAPFGRDAESLELIELPIA